MLKTGHAKDPKMHTCGTLNKTNNLSVQSFFSGFTFYIWLLSYILLTTTIMELSPFTFLILSILSYKNVVKKIYLCYVMSSYSLTFNNLILSSLLIYNYLSNTSILLMSLASVFMFLRTLEAPMIYILTNKGLMSVNYITYFLLSIITSRKSKNGEKCFSANNLITGNCYLTRINAFHLIYNIMKVPNKIINYIHYLLTHRGIHSINGNIDVEYIHNEDLSFAGNSFNLTPVEDFRDRKSVV